MTPSPRGPARTRALVAALLGALLATSAARTAAQDDDAGAAPAPPAAHFEYRVQRTVGQGTGTYEGYQDSLVSSGRYEITTDAGELAIHGTYRWRYQGERCEDGEEDRRVRASIADRLYAGRTDLDDYDESPADVPLGVWLWLPPTVHSGDVVRILEHDFTVQRDDAVELGGQAIPAILAETHGESVRNDAYGSFRVLYSDTYWFDERTGYFLRSEHTEVDENDEAGFEQREIAAVTSASYLAAELSVPLHPVDRCHRPAPGRSFIGRHRQTIKAVGGVLAFLGLFYVLYRILRPQRGRPTIQGQEITVTRASRAEDVPDEPGLGSGPLAPFAPHLARVALRGGDEVFVARAGGQLVGVGIADDAGRAAAIFAPHADACEQLRRALKVTEHFSEHRHETLPSVVTAARAASETAPTPAYNLIETWSVLDRDASPAPAYDAERVTRATEADLPALADLSFEVSQLRRESHRKAFLDEGGTVLVARIDGRIEGAAYLSVVGDRARLWGLAVRVDARGRGLGAELVRAAIAHAAPLGATRIVTEVPPDAIGARALLEAEGFRAKSELHVESAAETRPTRKIPWR